MPRKRGNGDGTIYKMESKGLWAAQLTIGVDANGKPKRKTIYGKRQADVRAKLDALKNELATGSVIEPDKITVAKYILSLVETDRALNQIGDNTYLRKLASCKRIAASSIGDRPLQAVRPPQVTQYLIEITSCSNSVIAKDYALLARCFRTALDNDLIRKDPMRGMKKPKSQGACVDRRGADQVCAGHERPRAWLPILGADDVDVVHRHAYGRDQRLRCA